MQYTVYKYINDFADKLLVLALVTNYTANCSMMMMMIIIIIIIIIIIVKEIVIIVIIIMIF